MTTPVVTLPQRQAPQVVRFGLLATIIAGLIFAVWSAGLFSNSAKKPDRQAQSVSGPLHKTTARTASSSVSPLHIEGAKTVDTHAAKALFDRRALFIDTRIDADWEAGRVPGAAHLELKVKFDQANLRGVATPGRELVIYCNGESCLRSAEATLKAVKWGFSNVFYFRDGFPAWKAAKFPIE